MKFNKVFLSAMMSAVVLFPSFVNAIAHDPLVRDEAYFIEAIKKSAVTDFGDNRIIAVLDTGINDENEELRGTVVAEYDFTEDRDNAYDSHGHGTKMASIIAASNDSKGLSGIAYKAKLLDVKIVDSKGGISEENFIRGINFAVEHGADVINMSFSTSQYSSKIEQLINSYIRAGIVFVAAAGNDGESQAYYPAGYSGVISVSSLVKNSKEVADYANYGEHIDAYIQDGIWTYDGEKYSREYGTSEAAAVVSSYITKSSSSANYPVTLQVNQRAYLLAQTESSKISPFSEGGVATYLDNLAQYNLIQRRLGTVIPSIHEMNFFNLTKYTISPFTATLVLGNELTDSFDNINAHILLADMFSEYGSYAYEHDGLEDNADVIMSDTNGFIDKLDPLIIELQKFSKGTGYTKNTIKIINDIVLGTKGKTDPLSKLIRKMMNGITSGLGNKDVSKYRTTYLTENVVWNDARVTKALKVAKGLKSALTAYTLAIKTYENIGEELSNVRLFGLHSVDFLRIMADIEINGSSSPLSKKLKTIVDEALEDDSNVKMQSLMNYLMAISVAKIGADVGNAVIKDQINELIVKKIQPAGSASGSLIFGEVIKDIINGTVGEVSAAYKYILYGKLVVDVVSEHSLYRDTAKPLTIQKANNSLIASIVLHKFTYHAVSYLHAMASNVTNFESYNAANNVRKIKNYKIGYLGSKYSFKELNFLEKGIAFANYGTVAPIENTAVYLSRALTNNSDFLSVMFVKDYERKKLPSIERYLDTVQNTFSVKDDSTYEKLEAVFERFNTLAQILLDNELAIANLLANKVTVQDIALNEKTNDQKISAIKNVVDLSKVSVPRLDAAGNTIDIDFFSQLALLKIESGHQILSKQMLINKDDGIPRKLFVEMLMKMIDSNDDFPQNPYNDVDFIKALQSDAVTIFDDIDQVLGSDFVTLNEQLWLEYANYSGYVNGYGVNGSGEYLVGPHDIITREQAMLIVGRVIADAGTEYNDASVRAILDDRSIKGFDNIDKGDVVTTELYKRLIGLCIQENIVTGKVSEIGATKKVERDLALNENLTIFQASVISQNLYKYFKPKSLLNDQNSVGDIFEKYKSQTINPYLGDPFEVQASIPTAFSNVEKQIRLRTKISGEYLDVLNLVWYPLFGELKGFKKYVNEDGFIESSVTYIAPSVDEQTIIPIIVKAIFSDSSVVRKEHYINVQPFDGYEASSGLEVQTSYVYQPITNTFTLSWQGVEAVTNVKIYSSFDNEIWTQVISENHHQGSQSVTITGAEDHQEIYFRVESTNVGGETVTTTEPVFSYSPKQNTSTPKEAEEPNTPQLSRLSEVINKNSVTLYWKRINDSSNKDNVDYYELRYADNARFSGATIVNVGNNAPGENIYESASYTVNNLQDDGRYYFSVRAVNSVGQSGWSSYESVDIELEDLPYFEIDYQLPTNGAQGVSKKPELRWRAYDEDGDQLEYYVVMGESESGLNNTLQSFNNNERRYFDFEENGERGLKPNTKYYWQVWVKEQGYGKDYYGGEYIKSPVWSFTTSSTGPDLAITNVELLTEVKPDAQASFKVSIKNIGTETSLGETIRAYYKKDGNVYRFRSGANARMENGLAAGEAEDVILTVDFRDSVTTYNSITYDNVLIEGNSIVYFDMPYLDDQDTNPVNNTYEYTINYENQGKPEFEYFSVGPASVYNGEQDFSLYSNLGKNIGRLSGIQIVAVDDLAVTKVTIEYRLNANDSWHLIDEIANDDDKVSIDYEWIIPDDDSFVTNSFQVRVRAYENSVSYSERISYPFPIYSNHLNLTIDSISPNNIVAGDDLSVTFSVDNEYPLDYFSVTLKTTNRDADLYEQVELDTFLLKGFDAPNQLTLSIPNDNRHASTEAYLEVNVSDNHGNTKSFESTRFVIAPNTKVTAPFNEFIDVYNVNYSSFPSGSTHQTTANVIKEVFVDDNNLVHLIVYHEGNWLNSSQHFRDGKYLYLTYNPSTKIVSSPVVVYGVTSGSSLPSESFRDFSVINDVVYVVTYDTDGNDLRLYSKQAASFSKQIILSGSNIDSMKFANIGADKLLLTYRFLPVDGLVEDRRQHVMAIHPNVETSVTLGSEYIRGPRIHDGFVWSSSRGDYYQIDADFNVTDKQHVSDVAIRVVGGSDYTSYNPKYIEMLIKDKSLALLTSDFKLQHISSLEDSSVFDGNNTYTYADVTVYEDIAVTVYLSANDEFKIDILDLNTNLIESLQLGQNYSVSDNNIDEFVHINRNKFMAIANVSRGGAYLAVADFSQDVIAPSLEISNDDTFIESDNPITLNWVAEDNADELVKFEVYQIHNGQKVLLETIHDTTRTDFSYELDDALSSGYLELKVVAYDLSGNSSFDSIRLKILSSITFESFTANKSVVELGDKLIFSWSANGGNATTPYTVYRRKIDEPEWVKLFTVIGDLNKSYAIDTFVGDYAFKIVSGNEELVLNHNIFIAGEIFNFSDGAFQPNGRYFGGGTVPLQWSDNSLAKTNVYHVLVKNDGESVFTSVADTVEKHFDYKHAGASFTWKITTTFNQKTIVSREYEVLLEELTVPQNILATFELKNTPKVTITFDAVSNATGYLIIRESNGLYQELATTADNVFIDTSVAYGESYSYSVIALGGDVRSDTSVSAEVFTSLKEVYGVNIDNANYQVLSSNALFLSLTPDSSVTYESYEVRLGVSRLSTEPYTVMQGRSINISGLNYGTTYYLEVYPLDYSGLRVSSSPAILTFVTGFDVRPITGIIDVSVDELADDHISISWNSLANVDEYLICRSAGSEEFICFDKTEKLAYVDYVGLTPGVSYRYIVKGANSNVSIDSNSSQSVVLPGGDPNVLDGDGDGVVDAIDVFPFDASESADFDGDGIGDNADTDDDNDGLPDLYETDHGLNPNDASDAASDADGDDQTALQEYLNGTDPNVFDALPLEQRVSVSGAPVAIKGGRLLLSVNYDVEDNNQNLSGLGLRIHYNSSDLTWHFFANILTTELIGQSAAPMFDGGDLDANADTDMYVTLAWAALNGGWPNQPLPLTLAQIQFDVSDNIDELTTTTPIGFSASSTSKGYVLASVAYDVAIIDSSFDIDQNGQSDALTDGLLFLRYAFGFRGDTLTSGVVANDAGIVSNTGIESALATVANSIGDIDGNGQTDALTDGLLLLRYQFGFRGETLIKGVVADGGVRATASEIEAYLAQLSR